MKKLELICLVACGPVIPLLHPIASTYRETESILKQVRHPISTTSLLTHQLAEFVRVKTNTTTQLSPNLLANTMNCELKNYKLLNLRIICLLCSKKLTNTKIGTRSGVVP